MSSEDDIKSEQPVSGVRLMHINQTNHNAGNVVNAVMTEERAAALAEKVVKALFVNASGQLGTVMAVYCKESVRPLVDRDYSWVFDKVKRILMEG